MNIIMTLTLTGKISPDTTMVSILDVGEISNGWVLKHRQEYHAASGKDLVENSAYFPKMDEALLSASMIFSEESKRVRRAAIEARR